MFRPIAFFYTLLLSAVVAAFYKVSSNLSMEKSIFNRLVENGLPKALALLVVAQSKHETAIAGVPFSSALVLTRSNLFGYGYVQGNKLQSGSGGKHPEDGGMYAKYPSLQNSIDDISGWYKRRSSIFFTITDTTTYANKLKAAGYYTDSVANYLSGLNHYYKTTL